MRPTRFLCVGVGAKFKVHSSNLEIKAHQTGLVKSFIFSRGIVKSFITSVNKKWHSPFLAPSDMTLFLQYALQPYLFSLLSKKQVDVAHFFGAHIIFRGIVKSFITSAMCFSIEVHILMALPLSLLFSLDVALACNKIMVYRGGLEFGVLKCRRSILSSDFGMAIQFLLSFDFTVSFHNYTLRAIHYYLQVLDDICSDAI